MQTTFSWHLMQIISSSSIDWLLLETQLLACSYHQIHHLWTLILWIIESFQLPIMQLVIGSTGHLATSSSLTTLSSSRSGDSTQIWPSRCREYTGSQTPILLSLVTSLSWSTTSMSSSQLIVCNSILPFTIQISLSDSLRGKSSFLS
jgi:hypothetical protein